jgi:hypothetical protein
MIDTPKYVLSNQELSGAEKRSRHLAMRCAKLAAQGLTHRNIAEAVGKKPEQIKALILRGERLLDLASAIPDVPSPD